MFAQTPMSRRLPPGRVIALALVIAFLAACGPAEAPPAAAATPMPLQPSSAAATATPVSTDTLVAEPTATPAVAPASYKGWREYTDHLYGFRLLYPPDWTAELDLRTNSTSYQHLLWLLPPVKQGEIKLSIGFRRAGEDYGIQRTGVGAGEFVTRGTVRFLGEYVTRWVLVAEGKDMSVLYNQAAETRRGDMIFTLGLDYVGHPTDPSTLPEDIQQDADMIVTSFEMAK